MVPLPLSGGEPPDPPTWTCSCPAPGPALLRVRLPPWRSLRPGLLLPCSGPAVRCGRPCGLACRPCGLLCSAWACSRPALDLPCLRAMAILFHSLKQALGISMGDPPTHPRRTSQPPLNLGPLLPSSKPTDTRSPGLARRVGLRGGAPDGPSPGGSRSLCSSVTPLGAPRQQAEGGNTVEPYKSLPTCFRCQGLNRHMGSMGGVPADPSQECIANGPLNLCPLLPPIPGPRTQGPGAQ